MRPDSTLPYPLQLLIDLYWSKDFLLNISAEAIGVIVSVVFIARYLDYMEVRRWNDAFTARIKRLLEEHRDMPIAIESMAIVGDVNVPHKLMVWSHKVQDRLRYALDLVPPKLAAPQYVAAEKYLEAIRDLSREFVNQQMPLSVLQAINNRAGVLAAATAQSNPTAYLWTEDFLLSLEPRLLLAEW